MTDDIFRFFPEEAYRMPTIAMKIRHQRIPAAQRPHPLVSVMVWEARRLLAIPSTGVLAVLTLGGFLGILWLERGVSSVAVMVSGAKGGPFFGGALTYDSVWYQLVQLTTGSLSLFTLALPFMSVNGLARDLRRNTHELLATTTLPTWAYFWGRYLIVLALGLGMALLLLADILLMAVATHTVLGGADYPPPRIDLLFAVWAVVILPLVILVSSVSFALGSLLPRRTNGIKLSMVILWFLFALILPDIAGPNGSPPSWYTNWDPTSATLLAGGPDRYHRAFLDLLQHTGVVNQPQTAANSQVLQALHVVEYQFVDFWSWFGPHLLWTGMALVMVLVTAVRFRRFCNA
jgi:hypothetical protein